MKDFTRGIYHTKTSAFVSWRRIVPGGTAGLQIRVGPQAASGRFDSYSLPPTIVDAARATAAEHT